MQRQSREVVRKIALSSAVALGIGVTACGGDNKNQESAATPAGSASEQSDRLERCLNGSTEYAYPNLRKIEQGKSVFTLTTSKSALLDPCKQVDGPNHVGAYSLIDPKDTKGYLEIGETFTVTCKQLTVKPVYMEVQTPEFTGAVNLGHAEDQNLLASTKSVPDCPVPSAP